MSEAQLHMTVGARGRPLDGPLQWLKAHPNAIRAAAVVVFFLYWEWAARDMSPLFMTYPSAIFKAAWAMHAHGLVRARVSGNQRRERWSTGRWFVDRAGALVHEHYRLEETCKQQGRAGRRRVYCGWTSRS